MLGIRAAVWLLLCALAAWAQSSEGIAAFNAGRYSTARTLLQKEKTSGEAKLYLALTEAAQNDCALALPVLIAEWRSENKGWSRLAGLAAVRCHSSQGNIADATAILADLAKRFPDDADVLYLAAKTEMKAFNDATFAMFQRAPASYRVHQLSAEILEIENRFGEAAGEYRKAIELNPQAPDLHYRLGRSILLGDHAKESLSEAADAFRAELDISPEDSAAEFQLGQIAQIGGEAGAAKTHFERALALSPQFATAAIALGKIYTQEKQYDRGIQLLKQAASLQPENEAAHYALLTAYRNAGQVENAQAEKAILDKLQKPPEGEFSNFLKKLGDKPAQP